MVAIQGVGTNGSVVNSSPEGSSDVTASIPVGAPWLMDKTLEKCG
jgi:hypothetical protein